MRLEELWRHTDKHQHQAASRHRSPDSFLKFFLTETVRENANFPNFFFFPLKVRVCKKQLEVEVQSRREEKRKEKQNEGS